MLALEGANSLLSQQEEELETMGTVQLELETLQECHSSLTESFKRKEERGEEMQKMLGKVSAGLRQAYAILVKREKIGKMEEDVESIEGVIGERVSAGREKEILGWVEKVTEKSAKLQKDLGTNVIYIKALIDHIYISHIAPIYI
tara:strand:- start:39 stop:473 length:435 start_codon:yes stop_codon:yes gene_type:complete